MEKAKNTNVSFTFPTVNRVVDDVKLCKVEPFWECQNGKYVSLYRIIAELKFGESCELEQAQNSVAIQAIDVNDDDGYFEYALTFDGKGDIQSITVDSLKWERDGQALHLHWISRLHLNESESGETTETQLPQEVKKDSLAEKTMTTDQAVVEESNVEENVKAEATAIREESEIFELQQEQVTTNKTEKKNVHSFLAYLKESFK